MEHHSNIVPWQMLCEQTGAQLRVAPDRRRRRARPRRRSRSSLGPRTRIVAVAHVSNALGTINPVRRDRPTLAHDARRAWCWSTAPRRSPHLPVDVQALGCDFYAFSGHKMYGPTGIGVLYGRPELLEAMPPYQGGGDMIRSVTFEKTDVRRAAAQVRGRHAEHRRRDRARRGASTTSSGDRASTRIAAHEDELLRLRHASALAEIRGPAADRHARERKAGVLSFVLDGVHPHDVGTILDHEGVAIRTGHHCAQPVMERFGVPATARASLACYNTREEIDALVGGLRKVREVFG